jgi:hypothetical protein
MTWREICGAGCGSSTVSSVTAVEEAMAESPSIFPEGELLFRLIAQRYGDRLSAEELTEVHKGIAGLATTAAALRAVRLENSLEPSAVFVPYRQEE